MRQWQQLDGRAAASAWGMEHYRSTHGQQDATTISQHMDRRSSAEYISRRSNMSPPIVPPPPPVVPTTTVSTSSSRKRPHHHHQGFIRTAEEHNTTGIQEPRPEKKRPIKEKASETTANNANTSNNWTSTSTTTTNGRCINVSERYEKVKRLGEGTYGVVYQARDIRSSNNNSSNNNDIMVALKRCIPHHQASDGFPITTLREIQALRRCARHKHIVHLHHVAVSRNGVFLVLEYWKV
jgi:Protein kinase domain